MLEHHQNSLTLTVNNYKKVVDRLVQPHKQLIIQAQQHFKQKVIEYKHNREKSRLLYQKSGYSAARIPSHFSEQDPFDNEDSDYDAIKNLVKLDQSKQKCQTYDLREWKSQNITSFPDFQNLTNYYEQIFSKKKSKNKNNKNYYDFRIDEKQMLVNIFNQIRSEEESIQFTNVIQFFNKCKLFYLYYNIKPFKLIDILRESAHTYQDKLTLHQFLNIFFYDRPNIIAYDDVDNIYIKKRCVLNQQSWKELKQIFSTLDTFGDETVNLQPFLFKIKNNYGNRQLINEPAIQYPQIERTIPLKKIIFVLENRCDCSQKIRWEQIQQIIANFKYISQPTIDTIYHKLIQRGQITKFSNYFMISQDIIDQIKNIFDRCPKYCEYFVKTNFICHELLQSSRIKNLMKDGIVRIQQKGAQNFCVNLDDQIRIIASSAEDYIDKDELLEYFSIKGPINTTVEARYDDQDDESCDEQNNQRLKKLTKIKSMQRLRGSTKKETKRKCTRYLTTYCKEFNLSTNKKESTMQRKTRQWVENMQRQNQLQYTKKFKANPIPVDLNPQKYKSYINKLEQIKSLKRQQFNKKREEQFKVYQYLKSNTYLFNKRFKQNQQKQPKQQYKFVSKSIPWFVTEVYMLDKINQKKKLRQKNLYIDNKIKIIRQWKKLPEVMMMEGDETSENHQDPNEEVSVQTEKEQNRGATNRKIKEVPNFKLLQQQFQEQLAKKKKEFTPTVPIQFKFSSSKPKKQNFQTAKQNMVNKSSPNFNTVNKHKASVQTAIVKPQIQIPTTAKYIDMVNYTHEKLQEKQIQKIREEQQKKQRKLKQANFAKFMRKKLKTSLNYSGSQQNLSKSKLSQHKYQWKMLKKQNEEDMCRIYQKVMARPFLFQSNSPKGTNQQRNYQSPNYAPIKKKNRINWKKPQQKSGKQVHQSPLKEIEAQMNHQSPKNNISPNNYGPQSQDQQRMNYLNQSF